VIKVGKGIGVLGVRDREDREAKMPNTQHPNDTCIADQFRRFVYNAARFRLTGLI
jgi:hypothetical protein